ncbi:MAG: hypothetical protein ACI9OD_001041 [Limisphaerales bacterium]|jgi:hypothetical protein
MTDATPLPVIMVAMFRKYPALGLFFDSFKIAPYAYSLPLRTHSQHIAPFGLSSQYEMLCSSIS